jgi:hypothetical protein
MPHEKICVKHKNCKGEIWLEKQYHKVQEPVEDEPVVTVEWESELQYVEAVSELYRRNYRISSTDCSDGVWRAVLVKED